MLVFLAGLVYIARQCCVVIDCLLTVFHSVLVPRCVQVPSRRCSSCIYTTSGGAAHGPRSSVDAAHGPGGYAAAALFLGGEEQQHGHLKLEECTARASTSKIVMARAQYAMRGSCLWTFWFSLWSIPACLRCHVAGFLRCHVEHKMWAAESTSPQTPSRPPESFSPPN